MKLSALQEQIVNTKEKKVIVLASAAAGKSTCLVERVKKILRDGANPERVIAFTFTNAAAEEMRKLLGEEAKGCFINTIHAYAYYLLTKNGIDVSSIIDEEKFDDFFELIKQHIEIIEPVDYLLLDEAQDSTETEFQFILDMIKPKELFIIGDLKQSIYEFRGGRPDILLRLMNEPQFVVYDLNENYRNAPAILRFAKKIITGNMLGDYDLYDDSISMVEDTMGYVNEIEYYPSQIISMIKNEPDYGKWFILTRSNAQIEEVINFLTKAEIPCDTFKKSRLTSEEFALKMKQDTVKVLTVHAAKGLETDNVVVVGVSRWAKKSEERRIAYVAATRAKKKLIWTKVKSPKSSKKIQSWE